MAIVPKRLDHFDNVGKIIVHLLNGLAFWYTHQKGSLRHLMIGQTLDAQNVGKIEDRIGRGRSSVLLRFRSKKLNGPRIESPKVLFDLHRIGGS